MKEASIGRDRVIVAVHQIAEVSQAGKGPFHYHAQPVASQSPSVLTGGVRVVAARRDDRLDATFGQLPPQSVAILASAQDQSVGSLARTLEAVGMPNRGAIQGLRHQSDFRWGGRVEVCSQRSLLRSLNSRCGFRGWRSTLAIDQNQPLCALSLLALADGPAPLFRRGRASIAKTLVPADLLRVIQTNQEDPPPIQQDPAGLPFSQPTPYSTGAPILAGKLIPLGAGAQDRENAFKALPIRNPGASLFEARRPLR